MEPIRTDGYESTPHISTLVNYAERGQVVGDFLTGMLENDLTKVMSHADSNALRSLRDIFLFIYNRLPMECWGTKERVLAWYAGGRYREVMPDGTTTAGAHAVSVAKEALRNMKTVEERMCFLADMRDIAEEREPT